MVVQYVAASNLWVARCEHEDCKLLAGFDNATSATWLALEHYCPAAASLRVLTEAEVTTLVEHMWEKIDKEFVILKTTLKDELPESRDVANQTGRLRGMAEMIAIFMTPHFQDADSIARECSRRYKAKLAGEPYETAGLGSRAQEPPAYQMSAYAAETEKAKADVTRRAHQSAAAQKAAPARARSGTITKAEPKIDAETAQTIREMYATGRVTVKQFADLYSVSELTITDIVM